MRPVWLLALWMLGACPAPTGPARPASGPKLPEPRAIDPAARGAAYLTSVAARIQPAWGQFLEDCRLRLPRTHPLNQLSLVASAELRVARDGRVDVRLATGSGNGDFDAAVFAVASDAGPFPVPPTALLADDDAAHLRWTFARDARQAGPATASVLEVKLPLLAVVERLIAGNAVDRAIERVGAAPADVERRVATEKVMTAVLREGLASVNGVARRAAVEAVARADVGVLAHDVHALAGPSPDLELRLTAIAASAQLKDPAVVPTLAAELRDDLASRPRVAIAKVEALVALGRGALARPALDAELAGGPTAIGLLVLARVPDAVLAAKVPAWMDSTNAQTRAAVCAALPGAAPDAAPALIAKGLRDADASVRAQCSAAVVRGEMRTADPAIARRLRELARDRDRTVRARAIAALGVLEPGHKLRAVTDPATEVRVASVVGAGEADLRTLAVDADPEVRAAALVVLGDRAPELVAKGLVDLSPAVRKAAISTLASDEALERLASDASPEVATAAVVRLAARRGRAAITGPMLASLGAMPSGSPARVRIALAWLLAR